MMNQKCPVNNNPHASLDMLLGMRLLVKSAHSTGKSTGPVDCKGRNWGLVLQQHDAGYFNSYSSFSPRRHVPTGRALPLNLHSRSHSDYCTLQQAYPLLLLHYGVHRASRLCDSGSDPGDVSNGHAILRKHPPRGSLNIEVLRADEGEVSMEQSRNARAGETEHLREKPHHPARSPHAKIRVSNPLCLGRGETGDSRENPPTSGIVRHNSHMRKYGVTRPGIEPGSPWWEASRLTAQPPWPLCTRRRNILEVELRQGTEVTVAEQLACSPPTKTIWVQSPAGSLRIFRMWESCRTMLLVGGFYRGSPVSPAALYSPQSPSLALKTSMLRAAKISSLTSSRASVKCESASYLRCVLSDDGGGTGRVVGGRVRGVGASQHAYPRRQLVPLSPPQVLQVVQHVAVVCVELVGVARRQPLQVAPLPRLQQRQRSPPTQANRVRVPAASLPDFRTWGSCRTMPRVGGFSRGSPVLLPALAFRRCSNARARETDVPEKTRHPTALSATFPRCENPGLHHRNILKKNWVDALGRLDEKEKQKGCRRQAQEVDEDKEKGQRRIRHYSKRALCTKIWHDENEIIRA
ncbi:hypothetical protein PR048_018470 [Dryococelus australis]|uniref:Uncharacterized protein n=1 Tax=Dryococelus australis TaxID=614101 RepID=A0ABQ9HCD2_9NEOP|nr:hypothetical protein PR048_018470 [Dryococelus australis]